MKLINKAAEIIQSHRETHKLIAEALNMKLWIALRLNHCMKLGKMPEESELNWTKLMHFLMMKLKRKWKKKFRVEEVGEIPAFFLFLK